MKKVYVIGHRNPDTDSICSAIAYANLKNQVEGNGYEAYRAGNINGETRYVLDTFGIKDPKYVSDVRPRLKDVNLNLVKGAKATDSLKSAREMMQTEKIVSLPVLDGKKMTGLVSISDVLKADMDVYDNEILAKAKTPYKNVVETLDGTLQAGDIEGYITEGKLTVSAASVDTMEEFVTAKDTVIVANREDAQIGAIQTGVQCVVVCMGTEVTDKVLELAKEKNCRIITTPYDTFTASRLICQAMPVSYIMATDTIVSFNETDFVDDVKEEMTKKRFRYFPVLNADNEFVGFISRRRILEFNKKQVILVDHNEVSQAVEGLEECEIMEIIDHHRIGSVETVSPVYFRNQPVGCTGTIVAQMYREQGIEITKEMAGLMCSAILSDTLMFRSPTCTAIDRIIAEKLAAIAHIEIEKYARDMFDAGSNLREKSAKEIFYQDFKKFNDSSINFGVGQISSMNKAELSACKDKLLPYMEEVRTSYGLDMVFFMMTDIINESTELLMVGDMCKEVIENAFETTVESSSAELPGVVSRKKQLIPAILGQLS
jgi:manganese-dependent inorganic pyrophosphatase